MTEKIKVMAIVGPTSSGKSALAMTLAQSFHGELINADARQLYQGLVIGTGSPTTAEKQTIPHHLFNELDPARSFSLAEWKAQAEQRIQEIIEHKALPILVGGTGLYIDSLLKGYQPPPAADPGLRRSLQVKTLKEQLALLQEKDPASFEKIDRKNPRRVLRALEVVLSTGKSFIEQRGQEETPYDVLFIGIDHARETVNQRIDKTIDSMIEQGWLEEVQLLSKQGIDEEVPSMTAIGYRELLSVSKGKMDLLEAIQSIKQKTHQYAKRQMTWFKRNKSIHWVKTQKEAQQLVENWIL